MARLGRAQPFRPLTRGKVPAAVGGSPNTVIVPAAAIAVSGPAPTIRQPHVVAAPAAAIAVQGNVPTIRQPHTVVVPAAAIAVSGPAPTIRQPHTVVVPAAAIAVSGPAPTILRGVANYIRVPAASIAVTAYAPTILVGGQAVTTAPTTGAGRHIKGRGKGKRPLHRRILVEIDGETFEVSTEAEAIELMQAARDLARQAADKLAQAALAKAEASSKPASRERALHIPVPVIKLAAPDSGDELAQFVQAQLDATRAAIADIYDAALRAAQAQAIAFWQQDEDEAIQLLLADVADEEELAASVIERLKAVFEQRYKAANERSRGTKAGGSGEANPR